MGKAMNSQIVKATSTMETNARKNPNLNPYILVMTHEQIDQLADILDDPFRTLTDLQKALFIRGYRLVKV